MLAGNKRSRAEFDASNDQDNADQFVIYLRRNHETALYELDEPAGNTAVEVNE